MFAQMRAGRGDGTYDRRLAKFTTPEVLIIDDVGLRQLRPDESEDLYEVIRVRYERTSTILTSNRDLPEWPQMFTDPLMTSAAMDRLLHHAHVIQLEGESYRNPKKKKAA